MPRRLVQATLLAALLPVLAPQVTSAESKAIRPAVQTTKSERTGLSKLWPWSKPTPAAAIVKVSAEQSATTVKPYEVIDGAVPVSQFKTAVHEQPAGFRTGRIQQVVGKKLPELTQDFVDEAAGRARVDAPAAGYYTEPRQAPVAIDSVPMNLVAPTVIAAPVAQPVPMPQPVQLGQAAPMVQTPVLQLAPVAQPAPIYVPAPQAAPVTPAPAVQAAPVYFRNAQPNPAPVYSTPVTMAAPAAPQSHPIATQTITGPGTGPLDAPLYPAPLTNIPLEVGSSMITNPAFDPHEMTYPHQYRGLYGPFYHRTTRFWVMTPLGAYKSERRVLTGTEVRVKYKSHISPFSFFFPPVTH